MGRAATLVRSAPAKKPGATGAALTRGPTRAAARLGDGGVCVALTLVPDESSLGVRYRVADVMPEHGWSALSLARLPAVTPRRT
eukprot:15470663-Alexandrium_andersonii.AAC.1